MSVVVYVSVSLFLFVSVVVENNNTQLHTFCSIFRVYSSACRSTSDIRNTLHLLVRTFVLSEEDLTRTQRTTKKLFFRLPFNVGRGSGHTVFQTLVKTVYVLK